MIPSDTDKVRHMANSNELWGADDSTDESEQDTRPDEEHIFSEVLRKPAHGFKMVDVGYSSISIRERHGIEPLIGLPLGASLKQFHDWIRSVTGSRLLDWEPVEISLYICAYTQMEPYIGTPWSYWVWRPEAADDAILTRETAVFALRHMAWKQLQPFDMGEYWCAVQRSHATEMWRKSNPNKPAPPSIVHGTADMGYWGSWIPAGNKDVECLDWPTMNLRHVLHQAKEAIRKGASDVRINDGGMSVGYAELTDDDWERVAAIVEGSSGNLRFWEILPVQDQQNESDG